MKQLKKKTKHYQFNYWPDTEAEADIELIAIAQEKAYEKITAFAGEKDVPIINYYLYSTRKMKGDITGNDGNGHANPESFEVHAVYNKETKCIGPHEDTHILTMHLGLPPQLFREGLAEYLSETWDGKPHSHWVAKFKEEGRLYSITNLMSDDFWYETDDLVSYPEAGSFIGFLISEIGRKKFLELYKELHRDKDRKENEKIFSNITDKTILELEGKWIAG